jgi:pimeloyl-ACP methyl ester carboxylesterase
VAGLVLEDPPLRAGTEPESFTAEMRATFERMAATPVGEHLAQLHAERPAASAEWLQITAEDRSRLDPRFADYGLDWFLRPWREVFAAAGFPIVVLAGDPALGSVVDAADEADCRRLLGARGTFIRIPGAGHSIRLAAPAAFQVAVLNALAAIDDSAEHA